MVGASPYAATPTNTSSMTACLGSTTADTSLLGHGSPSTPPARLRGSSCTPDLLCLDNYRVFLGRERCAGADPILRKLWAWSDMAFGLPRTTDLVRGRFVDISTEPSPDRHPDSAH